MRTFDYTDMMGRDICLGDYFLYAGVTLGTAELKAGQVVNLSTRERNGGAERVVVARTAQFYAALGAHEQGHWRPQANGRTVMIGNFAGLAVVPRSLLPEGAIDALSDRAAEDAPVDLLPTLDLED